MTTYETILSRYRVEVPEHLAAQATIPVLAGLQRQGDILIRPIDRPAGGTPVSAEGVQVVRGEATGNTHWLSADGLCLWAPTTPTADGLAVGVLTVTDGAVGWLIHTDEHGANGVAPGVYELRRQREQADEARLVAD